MPGKKEKTTKLQDAVFVAGAIYSIKAQTGPHTQDSRWRELLLLRRDDAPHL